MNSITAIILTYNEEKHIARCIESLQGLCERICIIDSLSTDRTVEIAQSLGADVLQHPWENNYAKQLNWGVEQAKIQTQWTIRMDADEYLSPALIEQLKSQLPRLGKDISGIEFPRKVYFKGKWIRRGGFYPIYLLRVWRSGHGYCEQRLMDEHIVLTEGSSIRLEGNLVDENLNDIHWWVLKHNNYARREAADILIQKYGLDAMEPAAQLSIAQVKIKRNLKNNFYNRLPLGLRSCLYFCFRFFIQLGFLDHPKVWVFHFMQGLWYRLLVDINVYEAEKASDKNPEMIKNWIQKEWKITLS